jgi:multidrug efflux pump
VGEIMLGGVPRAERPRLDRRRPLDAHGVTISEVIAALRREHVELPAGRIETEGREVNVRVLGEAIDLEGFAKLVVKRTAWLASWCSGDVALVEDGFEDLRRLSRVNG